jgi:hypothetical protein
MPLIRSESQSGKSLEKFYLDQELGLEEGGKAMVSLITYINEYFKDTTLWGLTSHASLILKSESTYEGSSYVCISCYNGIEFNIDYLIPEEDQPWPHARISGVANGLECAFEYVLLAMKNSKGWEDCAEL